MGSQLGNMSASLESVESFKFHDSFTEETNNGLYFNDIYLPEEIVSMILSYIEPNKILSATLVCKKWCNLIKSHSFWSALYFEKYNQKPKKLPWYVYYCLFATTYFNQNLIRNGNGQNNYDNWRIIHNEGDGFRIEDPPDGADPLPMDVPEFNGKTSCFATSFGECNKLQEMSLGKNQLMQFILSKYKPHIYLSEWVAGRFDCGCVYTLCCKLYGRKHANNSQKTAHRFPRNRYRHRMMFHRDLDDIEVEDDYTEEALLIQKTGTRIDQWAGSPWSKVELVVKEYPDGVERIVFQHLGMDTQFWKGHYGSKMAGGVLKILFDSMQPC